MNINTEMIEKLNPCQDRLDNYLQNYKDFDGHLQDFIVLEHITYGDKVWVVTKLFTKEQNVKWAILCASRVLHIFEEKFPNDKRPRRALEAAEAWLNNPTEENAGTSHRTAYSAAHATATDDAAYAPFFPAPDAALSAAAYAAYSIKNTAVTTYAVNDAIKAASYSASAASYSASADPHADGFDAALVVAAIKIEEEVNLLLMLECI